MTKRLQSIDILRGLAAFMVFIFHMSAFAGFDKRVLPDVDLLRMNLNGLPNFFSVGATGVSLFFVISGFVMTITHNGLESSGLMQYYLNRFWRIYPAYLTALMLSVLVCLYFDSGCLFSCTDLLAHVFFLHGLHPAYFLSLNGALWSMATEVQFYLLFPFMLLLYRRYTPLSTTLSIILFTLAFRSTVEFCFKDYPIDSAISIPALINYQIFGRLAEFCVGIFGGLLYLKKNIPENVYLRTGIFITLLLSVFTRMRGPAFPVDVLFGIFYGTALLFVLRNRLLEKDNRLNTWLANFGKISYSFFLIHYPIAIILITTTSIVVASSPWTSFLLLTLSFPIHYLVSVLLYKHIEEPIYKKFRWKN